MNGMMLITECAKWCEDTCLEYNQTLGFEYIWMFIIGFIFFNLAEFLEGLSKKENKLIEKVLRFEKNNEEEIFKESTLNYDDLKKVEKYKGMVYNMARNSRWAFYLLNLFGIAWMVIVKFPWS